MNIITGKRKRAQKVVVYGPEGIGKSTFAAQFPRPIFIDTEGSTDHMDVARVERPTSWVILLSYIRNIKDMPGGYQTLVIDTIDWAETLCIEHICAINNKAGIEAFGYGNGYVFVKEEMGKLLNLLDEVIAAGMNVVLTAHAQIRKFEQPDELGAYDRFELKLGKKTGSQTAPLIKEWADMVLFANYKNDIITTDSNKRKATGGKRLMYATHNPAWDAKNRHNLPDVMPFDYGQITAVIPDDIIADDLKEMLKDVGENYPEKDNEPKEEKIEDANLLIETNIPKPLKDLMAKDSITLDALQNIVASRGKYPANTPFENYDPAFVTGWIIPNWEAIVKFAKG